MAFKYFKKLAIPFIVVVTLGLLLLPETRNVREAARRTQCKNNLKQLLYALHDYESTYHAFPPAHTADANGNPLHSWRTLILPYLGQRELYASIDLAKPWNDPANKDAYNSIVPEFRCPSTTYPADKTGSGQNKTTYMAVVTPDSCLRSVEARQSSDIEDDRSATLMLIEVAPESAVHWMAPVDADESTVLNFGTNPKRPHVGGGHIGLVNGTVRFLSANIPQDTLRALISIAGHESLTDF